MKTFCKTFIIKYVFHSFSHPAKEHLNAKSRASRQIRIPGMYLTMQLISLDCQSIKCQLFVDFIRQFLCSIFHRSTELAVFIHESRLLNMALAIQSRASILHITSTFRCHGSPSSSPSPTSSFHLSVVTPSTASVQRLFPKYFGLMRCRVARL